MRLEHLCLFYRKKTYPMKPSSYLILFSFLALTFSACGDDQDEKAAYDGREYLINNANHNPTTRAEYARLEFPRIKGGDNNLVVVHSTNNFGVNYSLEWDVQKKSQRWSCYQMYSSNSLGGASRYYGNPQYPADPDLPSYAGWTPEDDPYYSTGYDHGHIVPSADRLCSSEANYQTFYLTNMQPMWNAFNAADPDIRSAVLRGAGVAVISDFAAQLCRDAGEGALAGRVTLIARVSILALCAPLAAGLLESFSAFLP